MLMVQDTIISVNLHCNLTDVRLPVVLLYLLRGGINSTLSLFPTCRSMKNALLGCIILLWSFNTNTDSKVASVKRTKVLQLNMMGTLRVPKSGHLINEKDR